MKELVIPIGIPRSGKSTYYFKNFSEYRLVSPDLIRFKLLDSERTRIWFEPLIEKQVWETVYKELDDCLNNNESVYFDATNITKLTRYPLVARARLHQYSVRIIYFNCPLMTAINADNCLKEKGQRFVGERVIAEMFVKLEKPEPWEYDSIVEVERR